MPTAGYSGTPLPKKLGIKEGSRVCFVNPPEDFDETIAPLPAGVEVLGRPGKDMDVIVFFTATATDLRRRFPKLAGALASSGGLWIGWPKRSSGVPTDLSENDIRAIGLEVGLVDNKVCAIDERWSGLRFVIRLKDRRR
ncbi:MAG: DUF3052 domain-containing protein [Actinomycetota bacterium]|nr:DUF3052 domain-containing protein [Actinomycetota bacterium]